MRDICQMNSGSHLAAELLRIQVKFEWEAEWATVAAYDYHDAAQRYVDYRVYDDDMGDKIYEQEVLVRVSDTETSVYACEPAVSVFFERSILNERTEDE